MLIRGKNCFHLINLTLDKEEEIFTASESSLRRLSICDPLVIGWLKKQIF